MLKIPFDERKCRELITLDTLHAYCGGLVPMPIAHKLNTYSQWRKFLFLSFFLPVVLIFVFLSNIRLLPFAEMEATRQRALVRASAAAHKQKEKEGASSLAPKASAKEHPSERVTGRMTVRSRKDRAFLLLENSQSNCHLPSLAMKLVKV